MTFHHGQVVITRNTPQAYSHRATFLKWVSRRVFQDECRNYFLQFADDCLDWGEHKRQNAMPATVRRNNAMHSEDGSI